MKRPTPVFVPLCLLLFSLASPADSAGQSPPGAAYDAVENFSATQNPSGAWSYGYRAAGGPFTPYAARTNFFGAGANTWQASASACCPMVTKNNTGSAYAYPNATSVSHHPAFLNLHPGPAGERSVVRWTAPAAGTYRVVGQFEGLDTGGTTSDVKVTHNSAVLFSGAVNGFGAAAPFTLTLKAAAGDAVEFSVGVGGNGTHSYDSTGLHAAVGPATTPPDAAAVDNLVSINFDNVAPPSIVVNQYRPHATFSANGFSAGQAWPALLAHDLRSQSVTVLGGSPPNAVASLWNNCAPGPPCANGEVFVDFVGVPVNKLSFSILNSRSLGHLAYVDVFIDYVYAGTYEIFGTARPFAPLLVDLRNLNRVTGVRVRQVQNFNGPFVTNTYYDDFSFVPDISLSITNPRVPGALQGTTRKALLGGDVRLQANASRPNGTYSWAVSGPHQHVSTSADQTAVLVRWTETGTHRVGVTYTLNGVSVTSHVNVNVVAPALTSFTANKAGDRLVGDDECVGFGPNDPAAYMLGCPSPPPEPDNPLNVPGITFSAAAQIPPGPYLSDPAQSGIKFVQLVSMMRKALVYGSTVCQTARAAPAETNSETGWQLDTSDPYSNKPEAVVRFAGGTSVTAQTQDTPRRQLRSVQLGPLFSQLFPFSVFDAYYHDEPFEMYVVYFTGVNPASPNFQRALGFPNPAHDPNPQVAYLPWKWGGNIYFDPAPQFFAGCTQSANNYCLQSATSSGAQAAPSRACATPTCLRPYSGNAAALEFRQCPNGPPPATSFVDTSRFYVRQHYLDFLKRDPLNPERPDVAGLDYWRGEMTQCWFDATCIGRKRVDVARAFFYSQEFIGQFPALADSKRCTLSYNKEFVRQCYFNYLRRTRDPETDDLEGFNFWVSKLNGQCPVHGDGAYNEMLKAFILSAEYRERRDFPAMPPLPWQ